MPILQVKEVGARPELIVASLPADATIQDEIDAMVEAMKTFDPMQPDVILSTCMAFMARCTEIYLDLVRIENTHRKAKFIRTSQLQKVMDLIDFQFKGASRLIEVRRQELDTTR